MFNTPVKMVTKAAFGTKLIIAIVILVIHLDSHEAGLRILGGRNSLKDEFPFAVRLEHQYDLSVNDNTKMYWYLSFCTGAALTPVWILAAAHCDEDETPNLRNDQLYTTKPKMVARYNSYYPNQLGQLSPITEVLAHPSFTLNPDSNIRFKNDIALYKTENLSVSRYGKISAIDYTSFVGHEVFVLGFGRTNASQNKKPLQVLKGMLLKCDPREGEFYGMLCVVPRCGLDATICAGDSGGPVVHPSGIVGINTVSVGDCNEHSYEVYPGYASAGITMLSPVFDWISNIIANKYWYDDGT